MKKFWKIQASSKKDTAEIVMYGTIGEDDNWDDVTAKQFSNDLKQYENYKNIDLRINSPGGSVFAGQAIYTMLKRHSAKITVYIDGVAASIASLIAMAGDKVIMPANAVMMIHNPWSFAIGNSSDMRKSADTLDKIRDSMLAAYISKTGMDKDELIALLDEETWMTAETAVEKGFADEVEESVKIAACLDKDLLKINGQSFDITKFKNFKKDLVKEQSATKDKLKPEASAKKELLERKNLNERENDKMLKGLCAKVGLDYDTLVAAGRADEEIQSLALAKISTENPEASVKAEQQRVADIIKLGKEYNAEAKALEFVESGKPVEEFKSELIVVLNQSKAPLKANKNMDSVGLSDKEARAFSLVKLINAMADPTDRKAQEAAKFEFEACEAAAEKYGSKNNGHVIPVEVLQTSVIKAATGDHNTTLGGNLIATDLKMASFIELLRNKAVVMQLGTQLTGLIGKVEIPRQTAATSGYWVGEDTAPTASEIGLDKIALNLKTVGARCYLTRQMKKQTTLDMEAFLRNDLATALALQIDLKALYGTGSDSQPTGIKNVSGINSATFAAANPTYSELVGMETEIAADNADVSNMAYLFNARMRGHCKTSQKFPTNTDGSGVIWEAGGTVNGYKALVTNQVANGDVFFGNFADLIIGMWGGLELTVDPYSASTKGGINITAFQDIDLAVRHAASFCYGAAA